MKKVVAGLLTTGLLSISAISSAAERPNILFIAIDDMRPQLGAYGHDYMVTPNLDKLASEGRLFQKHYVQVPTCGPSRACLLKGKNLLSRKEISHPYLAKELAGKDEPVAPETFIHHFKKNGYYTVGTGKISHSKTGFHKGHHELPHSWSEFMRDPESREWHSYADGNTSKKKIGKRGPAFECADVPDNRYPDGVIAEMAVKKLDELAKTDKPFFMAVGFIKPHLPFNAPKKYWDMYEREKIPLSPNPDKPSKLFNKFLHPSSEFFKQYDHPERGGAGKRISDDYAREIIHGNFASISYMDAQVGKVLNKLKELNLDKNTIVVAWGDHGWHLGDHTIWGKHSTFERSLKSTMMVKIPGMNKPGVTTDGLIASVDIYPTLCDIAGIKQPDGLDGSSFKQLLDDPNAKGKKAVLSYWRDIISMRTDRYRLAVFNDGKKQEMMLFDHKKDPNETNNIAKQSPEIISELLPQIKTLNKGYLPGLK